MIRKIFSIVILSVMLLSSKAFASDNSSNIDKSIGNKIITSE